MHLIALIEGWPKSVSITVGALLVAVIGILDYVTGYQLTFSAFYLLPIFILAWLGGQWGGLGGAVASAATRTIVDQLSGKPYPSPLYVVWNTGMRLVLFIVVAQLISIVRQYVDQEKALARIDHLTGAANTRSFMEMLKAEVERSRRYARRFTIAYFDLDNFKSVNDAFGHAAGDELLKSVVSMIRAHIRVTDVIARLGGDEFALLLPETDESAARAALSKIQSHIQREMQAKSWPVTVSIGSFTCSDATMDVDELIHQADDLMYAAKYGGKKRSQVLGNIDGTSTQGATCIARTMRRRTHEEYACAHGPGGGCHHDPGLLCFSAKPPSRLAACARRSASRTLDDRASSGRRGPHGGRSRGRACRALNA